MRIYTDIGLARRKHAVPRVLSYESLIIALMRAQVHRVVLKIWPGMCTKIPTPPRVWWHARARPGMPTNMKQRLLGTTAAL